MRKHLSLYNRLRVLEQRSRLSKDKREQEELNKLFDLSLLTPHEWELSDTIHLIHDIAVRLGYGRLVACRYRFDHGMNPHLNDEVMEKCLAAATPEEVEKLALEKAIHDKNMRLTAKLTNEEKDLIKRHNEIVRFFDSSLSQKIVKQGYGKGHTREELDEARLMYKQIMARHGEQVF